MTVKYFHIRERELDGIMNLTDNDTEVQRLNSKQDSFFSSRTFDGIPMVNFAKEKKQDFLRMKNFHFYVILCKYLVQ